MKPKQIYIASLISLVASFSLSCGESKPPTEVRAQPISRPDNVPSAKAGKIAAAASADSSTPAPPRDAQVTIFCTVISGPGHVEKAKQLKDQLIKATHQNNWYVRHDEQQSTLYFGYYRTMDPQIDPKEAGRVRADRDHIAQFKDVYGNVPFQAALPVAIDAPDPTAPPEFNLLNAKGYWSLQIAAYEGEGRKQAAVEAVKAARKMGIEAYYHHGPNVSAVCVGAWPEAAVRKGGEDPALGVDPADHDTPLLVLGAGVNLPPEVKAQYRNNLIDRDSGKKVEVLEEKDEIVDPTLINAMKQFPYHSLNGYEDTTQQRNPANGKTVTVRHPSLLVAIPHSSSILDQDANVAPPSLITPLSPPPQGGTLRSFGQ